ncbi:16458_t:CDS:2 [Dentiscutata erythropus]|uniref:16458_t:CDS:1 n=1 Tax=Dentiscutata erythropus TaxID=1348616 RepID=A0A9N9CW47_9GLOM|nr:16458_t:CDS:2 [Dentiscutata erythropus]
MPLDDARQIYQQIPNATENYGTFDIPCESNITVKIKIGGADWDIDSRDLINIKQSENQKICTGMIIGYSNGDIAIINEWILGTTFLKNVYSVYDWYNNQIGFAKLHQS